MEEKPEIQDLVDELRSAGTRSLFEGKLRDLNQAAALFLKERTASMTPVFFPLSQGDVVLFSLETVHGAAAVEEPRKTRMGLIMDWQNTQTEQYLAGARWPGEVPDKYAEALPKEPDLVSALGKYRIPDRHTYDRLLSRIC